MKSKLEKISLAVAVVLGLSLSLGTVARAQTGPKDIVDTAVAAGSFKTLAAALQAAGLVDTLKSKGPFTVFAPTDEAFAKLPPGTVQDLLKPENKEKLVAILTYHVVPRRRNGGSSARNELRQNSERKISDHHRQEWHGNGKQRQSGQDRHRLQQRCHSCDRLRALAIVGPVEIQRGLVCDSTRPRYFSEKCGKGTTTEVENEPCRAIKD